MGELRLFIIVFSAGEESRRRGAFDPAITEREKENGACEPTHDDEAHHSHQKSFDEFDVG